MNRTSTNGATAAPPALFDPRPEGCEIAVGNAVEVLQKRPASTFRVCVTSPPYWGLRDYGIDGQIGAESTLNEYIDRLVNVFAEVHRVLSEDGTLWLNLGDGYTSGNRRWRDTDRKNPARAMTYRPKTPPGLKPKDLMGIPWRVALALQEAGWYLRCDVIWHKPNCQPESVKDRPTRSHEYVFMFSKSDRYFYDRDAIAEATEGSGRPRNRRSVWTIPTEGFPDAHFATFPADLIEPCILAGSQQGDYALDPFFGSGTLGEVCTRHDRKFLGIELNPTYAALARKRLVWEQ